MLAQNKYTAFEYGGDMKTFILESNILSFKIRIGEDDIGFYENNSRINSMNDERIVCIAKEKALKELSKMFLEKLDIYVNRSVEYRTTDVIFSIRILDDISKEKYEEKIDYLKNKIKMMNEELDYINDLKFRLSCKIKEFEDIKYIYCNTEYEFKRSLSGLSFWERLWFAFTGRVYLLENFKEDN